VGSLNAKEGLDNCINNGTIPRYI